MFEQLTSAIRRTTGNRFTPCISLILSAATFVLTLLVILPGAKSGSLEKFHLITLNTSNVGAEVINFTPITSQAVTQPSGNITEQSVQRNDRYQGNKTWLDNSNSSSMNANATNANTTSTTTFTVSTPTQTTCPTPNIETLVSDLIGEIISDLETEFSGGEGQRIISNITAGVETGLQAAGGGELSQVFGGILQNLTLGLESALSSTAGQFFSSVVGGLLTSSAGGSSGSNSTSEIGLLFKTILGNFTDGISTGLSKAESQAALGITETLGIEQFYALHLREVCAGNLSNRSDPRALFNITGCYSYSEATTGFVKLLSNIPTSTAVGGTNISIPAIAQIQEVSIYLTSLLNTLDQTIFAFYILGIIGSGFVFLGSLAAFVFPSTPAIMYNNLAFSIIGVLFNLAGSATVTAFITTANNIVNLFGEALGLKAGLGTRFLILTWVSFGLALLTNLYVLAVWFFQFRTISVKVERRSSQDMGNWKGIGIGIGIGPEPSDNTITRPVRRNTVIRDNSDETMMSTGYRNTVIRDNSDETIMSTGCRNTNTLRNSRSGRNSKGYADF